MAVMRSALVLGALVGDVHGVHLSRSHANPIRKVINMLKKMDTKVEAEGKQSSELFDKYMCYCSDTDKELEVQIAAAQDKIPQVESSIKQTQESHTQLTEALKKHKQDREDARTAIATSISLRDKAAATYAAESTRVNANIAALTQAIAALTKGMGGFLQTKAASVLRQLAVSMDMSGSDRDVLSSYLQDSSSQGADAEGYEPSSGEINGILKQLKETMEKELAELTSDEESSITEHDDLVAAKKKEVQAANEEIEEKTGRVGDLAVEITTLKADKKDTEDGLAKDADFQGNLKKTCKNKKAKFEVYTQMMSEERIAIADTIKLLNDDDALDLFKKTLPSFTQVSLLQVADTSEDVRREASAILRRKRGDPRLDLVQMAIQGQRKGFDAMIGKVDVLVGILQQEQKEDDQKKVYCEGSIDKTEDEKKVGDREISDRKTSIEQSEGELQAVTEEIQKLMTGIGHLDAEVDEQTHLRKEKHAQIVETLAQNNAARSLLDVAKNRLAKFYNPQLYKAKPKRELAEEDRIAVNMGGTAPPTPAPGGIAGTGITAFLQVSSDISFGGAMEADLAYEKKVAEEGGVVGMIDLLREEMSKEIVQLESQDKEAQQDYEQFINDSSAKRKIDSKAVAAKEGAKADLEATIQKQREALRGEQSSVKGTEEELAALHGECDWLLSNHDLRTNARVGEIDALQKAKAVLAGADYS